jgi:hypothetical protein
MPEQNSKSQTNQPDIAQLLRDTLERIDYGTIEITIHNSQVVQVETSQKIRFNVK